jgi:hypothetical protein
VNGAMLQPLVVYGYGVFFYVAGANLVNGQWLAVMMSAVASLLACTSLTQGPSSRSEHSPESISICTRYGFASGTESFDSCASEMGRNLQAYQDSEKRCEAVRQEALRTTPAGTFSSGFGTSMANAEAAYRMCLSEKTPLPINIELPNGKAVTCQRIENVIQCD